MSIKISIASARVNAGLTQKELAKACKVSESTIIKWEKGETCPHVKRLPLLEQAFGIPLDYVKIPY